MKKTITTILLMLLVFNINGQKRKEFFKSPRGKFLIFPQIYTYILFFQMDAVWPRIRVEEARRGRS